MDVCYEESSATMESTSFISWPYSSATDCNGGCQVCGTTNTVRRMRRSGIPACEACRKFFLRNLNADLHCIAGDNQCAVDRIDLPTDQAERLIPSNSHFQEVYGVGSRKRRLNCPKCRLAKCYSVGMRVPSSSTSSSSGCNVRKERSSSYKEWQQHLPPPDASSMSSTCSSSVFADNATKDTVHCFTSTLCSQTITNAFFPLHDSISRQVSDDRSSGKESTIYFSPPSQQECAVFAEDMLSASVNGIGILQRLPYIPMEFNDTSTVTAIMPAFVEYWKVIMSICSSFVKQLPGYSQLPLEDRNQLFKNAFLQIALTQATQPNSSTQPYFGLHETTQSVIFHHFPHFRDVVYRANEIALVMAVWKPSFAEFALLQTLIFYNYKPNVNYSRPDIVYTLHESVVSAMKTATHGAGDETPETRWNNLERLLNLLSDFSKRINDWSIELAVKYPAEFQSDGLFYEAFHPSIENVAW